MRALVEACRPRQWVKNLFVAAPLVFAKRLTDPRPSLRALAAVAIFCLVSSAVYLWNDLIDVEKDRVHPHKQKRPIAVGRLSTGNARIASATLATAALALSWLLDWRFAACVLRLSRQQRRLLAVGQARRLPRRAVDRRRLPRCAWPPAPSPSTSRRRPTSFCARACSPPTSASASAPTSWRSAGERAGEQRAVLRAYRPSVLRAALFATAAATFVCYVLYTRAEHTVRFFGTTRMLWTAPFAAFGLLRFFALVQLPKGESPTEEILKDCTVHAQPSDLGSRHHPHHLLPLSRLRRVGRGPYSGGARQHIVGRRRDAAACHR